MAKPIDAFEPWLALVASVTILAFVVWAITRFRANVSAWRVGQLILACGLGTAVSWSSWLALSNGGNTDSLSDAIWVGVFAGTAAGGAISAFAIAWIWFGTRSGGRASPPRG